MKLSILIPVYNDKDYIQRTIDQIRAVRFQIPYEIVAVDDASTDGSKQILESITGITKIFHKKNIGKGGAIATGLQHVTGDIIVIQDDDCEYDPAVIPLLIAPIINGESDVVYGSRFLQKNSMFFIQKMENIAITSLANILIGHRLTDIETGHKAFSKNMAEKINLTKKGFEFDMEITLQFIKHKARIKELPTKYTARSHAQGKKITYKDGIRSILTLLKLTPKERIQKGLITIAFFAAVFFPRLIGLGHILTVDEPLWLSRGETFINGLSVGSFEKTVIGGQPGVTTTWLVGLVAPWGSLFTGQLAIALATGTLVILITYFLRILIGKKWGTISGFFLALDPFLIAHSRIVHTDALLALFYLASITCALCAFTTTSIQKRYIVFSAILAAGALLTKIFGIILVPTTLFILCLKLIQQKKHWLYIARIIGLWTGVFILATFIAWPALWFNSDKVFNILFSSAARHGEGTRSEEITSTSLYYLREIPFRSTIPVAILLPFTIWQWKKRTLKKHAFLTFSLVLAGLFYLLVLQAGSDKSDRYILFTHLTLLVAAPLGLRGIFTSIKARQKLHQWATLALALPLLYLTADVIRIHPYYLAHYNRLYPIEEDHKLGWGEGLEQAANWIQEKNPNAKVLSYYPRVFSYFYSGETETITHLGDANATYAVLYRSMFERGEGTESDIIQTLLYDKTKKLEHTIWINGLPYAWIFSL